MLSLSKAEKRALRLLARGGARYGTMHGAMSALRDRGLAYAHDKGRNGPGRWTWRPTLRGLWAAQTLGFRAVEPRSDWSNGI